MNKTLGLIAAALLAAVLLQGEEPDPSKFYKLDFTVKEVDGAKVLNSRSYSTYAGVGHAPCSMRTDSALSYNASTVPNSIQLQVAHLEVSIDCSKLRELDSSLALTITAAVKTIVQDTIASPVPIVRANSWNAMVLIPIGKTTTIFSSDDLTSKHKMQMDLTATPAK